MVLAAALLCGTFSMTADAKQISSFAKNGMLYAIARGMISGKFMKNGDIIAYRLDPQGKATRAEAAKIFYLG